MESPKQVFQSISKTAITTGLSEFYLRKGVREGQIPAIMSGKKYLINVPALIEMLNEESQLNASLEV